MLSQVKIIIKIKYLLLNYLGIFLMKFCSNGSEIIT